MKIRLIEYLKTFYFLYDGSSFTVFNVKAFISVHITSKDELGNYIFWNEFEETCFTNTYNDESPYSYY